MEYNNLWHYWLILSTSLLRMKINRRSVFENTKTCPLVSNKIQSTFSTCESKNAQKKEGRKEGGRGKEKQPTHARKNLTNVFDRRTDGFSCEFSWSTIKGRFLRASRSASPRWSAVFTVCFERKYNEFSGVAPPANERGYSSVSRYRFSRGITRYTGLFLVSTSRNRFDFPSNLPLPLPPLRLCLLEMFFNISGARILCARACIVGLVSEKFPRIESVFLFHFIVLLPFSFSRRCL